MLQKGEFLSDWRIRMKKKYLIIVGIIVLILVVIVCFWKPLGLYKFYLGRDNQVYCEISWVDFIRVNDITYTKNNTNSTVSESEIDKEIGIVQFETYDSIHYSGYKIKNWDAAFLNVNTKLFTIKNEPRSIAALVNDIYYKYSI